MKVSKEKRGQSVSVHVKRKTPCERIPSVTTARRGEMQIGFLSNCNHTLIVHWGVGMKCRNTSSLATRLIQIRSFMRVFFALIIMLRDREPSSSVASHRTRPKTSLVTEPSFQVPSTASTCTSHNRNSNPN